MKLSDYYKSFFSVKGATPFFSIQSDIKKKYFYLLLQRLSLKNNISNFLKMNVFSEDVISNMLHIKYGFGVGGVPKYFWFKLDGGYEEFYKQNEEKIKILYSEGFFDKYNLHKFKDVKPLLKKSRLWKKKPFVLILENIKISNINEVKELI